MDSWEDDLRVRLYLLLQVLAIPVFVYLPQDTRDGLELSLTIGVHGLRSIYSYFGTIDLHPKPCYCMCHEAMPILPINQAPPNAWRKSHYASPLPVNTKFAIFIAAITSQMTTANAAVIQWFRIFFRSLPSVVERRPTSSSTSSSSITVLL
jgi:hypothetical protein